ncbi:hypothetical protein [Tardiphaga sp.]|uniref:hypothetical protein n=1 Tax=Tardiphaga sp. TaxID=1926292 RepID=UPI0025E6D560|nr:hypothetical protein [Tardiphaga sp.]
MGHSLIRKSSLAFPQDLILILGDPPLLAGESRDKYDGLLAAVAQSIMPRTDLDWMFVRDIADISWQILRLRRIEVAAIELVQKEIVLEHLKSTRDASDVVEHASYRIFSARDEADRWARDPKARKKIDARLAACGISSDAVLAMAYDRAAPQLGSIHSRIAYCERQRSAILRDIERRDETYARKLGAASDAVIDAEFSEAAE